MNPIVKAFMGLFDRAKSIAANVNRHGRVVKDTPKPPRIAIPEGPIHIPTFHRRAVEEHKAQVRHQRKRIQRRRRGPVIRLAFSGRESGRFSVQGTMTGSLSGARPDLLILDDREAA